MPLPVMPRVMQCLVGCMLALAAATLAAQPAEPESPSMAEVSLTTPRSIGWMLGDVLELTATITLPKGYTLEPASLPPPGALNYWLELREITPHSRRKGGQVIWQLTLHYQTFYVPLEARQRRIPGLTLRFSREGEEPVAVSIPGWTFTMSPLRQIAQVEGGLALQDDAPIQRIAPQPMPALLALAALLLLSAGLAHHYARWPFQQRPARPFTQAHRALRRQHKRGGEAAQALIVLHRAFDAAAGHRLLADDLDAFIAAHPHLHACQVHIARFFAASRGQFFAGTQAQMALPELIELARLLAQHERQQEAHA